MLQTEKSLIKLRIDVDYAYPSRQKSFLHTALNAKVGKDYLRNSKILARMINESPVEVKAYWFFTPKTIPDKDLLQMLNPDKHEVALHVATDPYGEMEALQKATERTIRYYTIHGTARLLGRLLWSRWKTKAPAIPRDFPLQSFHEFPTLALDDYCCGKTTAKSIEMAEYSIAQGKILEIHPEWLLQRGTINHRGPYYEVLRNILKVDEELRNLVVRRKLFFRIANNPKEYQTDLLPSTPFLEKLKERGINIFTFIERKWSQTVPHPQRTWVKTEDNIALLEIRTYDEWWDSISKKTRNMVRKAEKSGVSTRISVADEKLAEGIWKIYNETPIRQERAFSHYGVALASVKGSVASAKDSTFIGAYLEDKLAGFIQLVYGDNIAIVSQILSLQKQWDKAVNNALLAKAIQTCANEKARWLMYGRIGNHPSLDRFKQSNGFVRFALTRYHIPLTIKGKIATKLGLHRELKDALPQSIKYAFIPIYNWISRITSLKK
jgi:hypothetical protein